MLIIGERNLEKQFVVHKGNASLLHILIAEKQSLLMVVGSYCCNHIGPGVGSKLILTVAHHGRVLTVAHGRVVPTKGSLGIPVRKLPVVGRGRLERLDLSL